MTCWDVHWTSKNSLRYLIDPCPEFYIGDKVRHFKMANEKYKKPSCRKRTVQLLHESFFAKDNWKTKFCEHYKSIYNNCDVIGLQCCKAIEFGKIRAITPLKVIQGHRCRYQSRGTGRRTRIIFARIVRPMNTLQLCLDSIHTKKLCSRLSSSEVHFLTENGHFAFLSPVWWLTGNVRCSS